MNYSDIEKLKNNGERAETGETEIWFVSISNYYRECNHYTMATCTDNSKKKKKRKKKE